MNDTVTRVGEHRGMRFTYRPTAYDVVVGDRVVCMLSDAVAAVEVTAIRYEEQDLTRHGVTHNPRSCRVVFEYRAAPWWVEVDKYQMMFDISDWVPVESTNQEVHA